MTGAIIRARMTRADLAHWNGVVPTTSRADASGGTVSGLSVGNEVDVLQVYGGGSVRSDATIASALTALGSRNVAMVFAPGTWSIEHNVSIPSNIVSVIPAGCVFDIDSGITLTFLGPVVQLAADATTGSGTAVGLNSELRGSFYGLTAAENSAAVTIKDWTYPELDIRRYGAIGDYDSGSETNGQVPDDATDNLAALEAAVSVAAQRGGGTIRIEGDADYYLSDSLDARGIDNLYIYIAPGTTVRTTKYSDLGAVLVLGTSDSTDPNTNVGVYGGGTVRTFQPDHGSIPAHQTTHSYSVGDYVLSTDTNGETRAYYCKTAGVSGAGSAPDVVNGSDTDGTVVWQDADNDNLIAISGVGVFVMYMDLPEASGKFITCQRPGWKNVWIVGNNCGTTNDKGIEVKGQQGSSGQENYYGDGVFIHDNVIAESGREGVEVEQSSFGNNLNRNASVVGNLIRSAGVINNASGVRINRCDGVEVRGNRVLDAGGNGFHIRLCKNVAGDIHSESAGVFGLHLQENDGFSFSLVYIKDSADSAVRESDDNEGGFIGRLIVDGATDGWETSSRDGVPPTIGSYKMTNLSGSEFSGAIPSVLPEVAGGKIQSFVLEINNNAGTVRHRITEDLLNSGSAVAALADRINGQTNSYTNTPTGTDSSTAMSGGGKISSANPSEFILDEHGEAASTNSAYAAEVTDNATWKMIRADIVRRSVDVNGTSKNRHHVQFRDAQTGAVFSLNDMNTSDTLRVRLLFWAP